MPCWATLDGWVIVERSDRMLSTGVGNGKPLQYSCLENPMNWALRDNIWTSSFSYLAKVKKAIYMKATNIWNRHLISSFPFPFWHGLFRKPFCYQLRLYVYVVCVCVWRRMLVKERMRLFYSQSIHVRQDSILSVNCLVIHSHCHNFF